MAANSTARYKRLLGDTGYHRNSPSQSEASLRAEKQEVSLNDEYPTPYISRPLQKSLSTSKDYQSINKLPEAGLLTPVIYTRRWYILFLFVLMSTTQNMVWNTWGPLADSMRRVFDWSDGTVALQTNWGPITYLFAIVPSVWLMDKKGMRWACLAASFIVTVGSALRCITSSVPAFTWLAHIGQILNGIAGPVTYAGPPVLSARWFPASHRTMATAVAVMGDGIGMAVSFILGPLMVPDARNHGNITGGNMTDINGVQEGHPSRLLSSNHSHSSMSAVKSDVMKLMYTHCGIAVAVTVLMLVYFPDKPPTPPSRSAAVERVHMTEGLIKLIRNVRFWMMGLAFALSVGVYSGWSTVLDVNLKPIGVTQDQAGWIGFSGVLAGFTSALVISLFADAFARRMRVILLSLFSTAVVMFLVFALMVHGIMPTHIVALFLTMGIASVCLAGSTPLFFELVCEASYPVSEGVTNGLLTWLSALFTAIYLLLLMFPALGISWINWVMLASVVACLPLFIFYKENYARLDTDVPNH